LAENKKYYWLKLQKDFFKRHDIRIIESMPNGKDYILFYLKLLAESISYEGCLRFSDTIPYSDAMLATITNTNVDIARSAIKVFTQLGLMEIIDDGTFYMNEIDKMIGSESEWAEKKRIYREQQKLLTDDTVTNEGQKKTMSDKSKSLEKEIDIDIKDIPSNFDKAVDNSIAETKIVKKNETKNIYGEFSKVKLTDVEYKKLIDSLGDSETQNFISRLDTYKASTGKTYKSDYATILNWHRKEPVKTAVTKPQAKQNKFHNFKQKMTEMSESQLEEIMRKKWNKEA